MPVQKIGGVILAGGRASRFGGHKALAPFAGGVLLDAIIGAASPQVRRLGLSVPRKCLDKYRARYGDTFPLLVDAFDEEIGPLNGILAALDWLRSTGDCEWLATFPCDTPFLPADIVEQLSAALATDTAYPVAAKDEQRLQGLFCLWPIACADLLRAGIKNGHYRSIQSALDALKGRRHRIQNSGEAFFNVNTPEDLARAKVVLARRRLHS
jgi:molybdopterin-guanine dinucleotide biosynthesis protein A